MNPLRVFLSIPLSAQIQGTLFSIQNDLRESGADVRWVSPENLHLTLKFFGDTAPAEIETIKAILQRQSRLTTGFAIKPGGLGFFPNPSHPKIIWIGLRNGQTETSGLFQRLEDEFKQAGVATEEREFHAHITLGRVKSTDRQFQLIKKLKNYKLPDIPATTASEMVLFKSTLTPDGPVYEALAHFPFAAPETPQP